VQSVEHPCHQCHSTIEDGIPFCPKCGAPQIRVAPEEEAETIPPVAADSGYTNTSSWNQVAGLQSQGVNWRAAFPGALLTGLVGGGLTILLGRIPLVLVLVLVLVGALSVRIYRARTKSVVTPGMGAKLGAFAGFFASLLDAMMVAAVFTLQRPLVQDSMRKAMEISGRNADPQSLKVLQDLINGLSTPSGMAAFALIVILFFFGLSLVCTALGGLIGAAFFGKDRPVA
jgi:hypothetical protein